MTEYWKSYAKKYCDVCKCWITDNKACVQFHESGKRHKENVAKKINELVKRATKDDKEKKELDEDMKKMEEAALKAYLKDVEDNPDHSAQFVKEKIDGLIKEKSDAEGETSSPSIQDHGKATEDKQNATEKKQKATGGKRKVTEGEQKVTEGEQKACSDETHVGGYVSQISSDRVWYEAKSDQGHSYYWNTQTNESVWEPPEGYVSVDEQGKEEERKRAHTEEMKRRKKAEETESAKRRKKEVDAALERESMRKKYAAKSSSEPDEEVEEVATCSVGPQTKSDPYGAWTTVVNKDNTPVDLQLPPSYQPVITPAAYTSVEPKIRIKEKTFDSSKLGCNNGPTNFKKRKFGNRGNARQRFDDDDS